MVIGLCFLGVGICLGCLVCDGLCCVQSGAFKITKEGFVLLQFAPAAGVRQYDWSRKQVFYTWLSLIIKCGYVCYILKILELWIYSDFWGQYWTGIIE